MKIPAYPGVGFLKRAVPVRAAPVHNHDRLERLGPPRGSPPDARQAFVQFLEIVSLRNQDRKARRQLRRKCRSPSPVEPADERATNIRGPDPPHERTKRSLALLRAFSIRNRLGAEQCQCESQVSLVGSPTPLQRAKGVA